MTAVVVVARGAPATDWSPAPPRARSRRRDAMMVVSHIAAVEQSPSPGTAVSGRCLQVQGEHNSSYAEVTQNVNCAQKPLWHCLISGFRILTSAWANVFFTSGPGEGVGR